MNNMNDIGVRNLRNDIVSQFSVPLNSIYTDWVIQQRELISISNAIQQSIYNVIRLKNDR